MNSSIIYWIYFNTFALIICSVSVTGEQQQHPIRHSHHYFSDSKFWRQIENEASQQWTNQTTTTNKKRSIQNNDANDDDINSLTTSIFQQQQQLQFNKSINFLLKGTKRFYFQLSNTKENISLIVTTCGGGGGVGVGVGGSMTSSTPKLEFYFINSKMIKKFRKRKIGRRSQNNLVKMINRKLLNHHTNRKLLLIEQLINNPRITIGQDMIFQPGLYIVQLSNQPQPEEDSDSDPGIQMELYLSSMSNSGQTIYPQIPPVATIMTKQIYNKWPLDTLIDTNIGLDDNNFNNESSVEIWWNPIVDDDGQYEYCLLIQENFPYQDNCLSDLKKLNQEEEDDQDDDDDSINQIDSNDSKSSWWLFSSELDRKSIKNKKNPIDEWKSKFSYFKCLQNLNETRLLVNGLRPGQLYFVDIFVRNLDPGLNYLLTSKYWTTNFTLTEPDLERKIWREHLDSMQTLHDSLFTGVFLDSKNQFRKRFLYKIPINFSKEQNVYIYLQPCSGIGPIQLMIKQISLDYFILDQSTDERRKRRHQHHHHYHNRRDSESISLDDNLILDELDDTNSQSTNNMASVDNNGILFFEEITETRTIEINLQNLLTNQSKSMIYLELELNTIQSFQSRSMVLLASNSLQKFPFPRLPSDKTIRTMETLRQCDSITLVWNASPDERVTYCILQRDAKYGQGFDESKYLCEKIKPPISAMNRKRHLIHDDNDDDDDGNDGNDNINSQSINQTDLAMVYDRYAMEYSQPTRKVLCRRYRAKKRVNNLIMQQVRKLYPGRQYVFMVTIKGRQHTLNYEQIWAETKDEDQCLENLNSNNRRRRGGGGGGGNRRSWRS